MGADGAMGVAGGVDENNGGPLGPCGTAVACPAARNRGGCGGPDGRGACSSEATR